MNTIRNFVMACIFVTLIAMNAFAGENRLMSFIDMATDRADGTIGVNVVVVDTTTNDTTTIKMFVSAASMFAVQNRPVEDGMRVYDIRGVRIDGAWYKVRNTVYRVREADKEQRVEGTTYYVQKGVPLSVVAQMAHTSVAKLKEWNHLQGDVIYQHETLFITPPEGEHPFRWCFLGGDPAEEPIEDQIERATVPEQVKAMWRNLLVTTMPDTVTVYRDSIDVIYDLGFGKGRMWPKAKPFWTDPVTLESIDSTDALIWPDVVFDGTRYRLMQFLVCNNAGDTRASVATLESAQEGPVFVAVTPESLPSTTPSRFPDFLLNYKGESKKPWEWVDRAVLWVNPQHIDYVVADQNDHSNFFAGGEAYAWRVPWVKPMVRAECAVMDETSQWSVRLGLHMEKRLGKRSGIAFQPGIYHAYMEDKWKLYEQPEADSIRWHEQISSFEENGWNLRLMFYTRHRTYGEAWYGNGDRTRVKYEFSVTSRPGYLYLYAHHQQNLRKMRTDHEAANGEDKTFPDDRNKMFECRLGVEFWHCLDVFGGYEDWYYISHPIDNDHQGWISERRGLNAGLEWTVTKRLRLWGKWTYFSHTRDIDRNNGRVYDDLMRLIEAGAVLNF